MYVFFLIWRRKYKVNFPLVLQYEANNSAYTFTYSKSVYSDTGTSPVGPVAQNLHMAAHAPWIPGGELGSHMPQGNNLCTHALKDQAVKQMKVFSGYHVSHDKHSAGC